MASSYGDIVFGDSVPLEIGSKVDSTKGAFHSTPLRWQPRAQSSPSVSLECHSKGGASRRFSPGVTCKAFVLEAALAGHAILRDTQDLAGEQSSSYHAMRLIFQKAPQLQEHLYRTFHRQQDLYVTSPERVTSDIVDILPDDFGLNPDGSGTKWTVAELMRRGREAAVNSGRLVQSEDVIIRCGILEAARLNPIEIDQRWNDRAQEFVRTILFDFGPTEPPDESIDVCVVERLLKAVEKHLDDDTGDFDTWFYEKADNLVHSIAKQKRNGGPIHRQVVRQVILETVFRSYKYVGDCVDLMMQDFARALPVPLTDEEQGFFDTFYRRQSCLGDLPLIVLYDKFELLREIIHEILQSPGNLTLWGTMLRMLQFHAMMVRNKRECEKYYKRQRVDGQNRSSVQFSGSLSTVKVPESAENPILKCLQAVASELRKRRKASCKCENLAEWRAVFDSDASTMEQLVFRDECARCMTSKVIEVPAESATQILRESTELSGE